MAAYNEEVGQRIRNAREQNRPDLSQENAAHALGVSAKQWGRWERGESLPRHDKWEPMAELLQVAVTDLRGEPPAVAENELRLRLDRIETKLDELLSRLPAEGLAGGLEAEAARVREQRKQNAAAARRKPAKRKAS